MGEWLHSNFGYFSELSVFLLVLAFYFHQMRSIRKDKEAKADKAAAEEVTHKDEAATPSE